jgi:hypothetical protein
MPHGCTCIFLCCPRPRRCLADLSTTRRLGCLGTGPQLLFSSPPIDLRRSERAPPFFPELKGERRNVFVIESVHVLLLYRARKSFAGPPQPPRRSSVVDGRVYLRHPPRLSAGLTGRTGGPWRVSPRAPPRLDNAHAESRARSCSTTERTGFAPTPAILPTRRPAWPGGAPAPSGCGIPQRSELGAADERQLQGMAKRHVTRRREIGRMHDAQDRPATPRVCRVHRPSSFLARTACCRTPPSQVDAHVVTCLLPSSLPGLRLTGPGPSP